MTQLSYHRYCDEIIRQTALLMSAVTDADLTAPVPSCPGWTTGRLLRHVGDVQRWAGSTVASRATEPRRAERQLAVDDVDGKDQLFAAFESERIF